MTEGARWTKPMPLDVAAFLSSGVLTRTTWRSQSEARMSAVLNAVLRGHSHAEIRAQSFPGQQWSGLGESYRTKHGPNADAQLARDVRKALRYASTLPAKTNPSAHRYRYSQSGGSPADSPQSRWLAVLT
ncbi:hypothetical protein BTO20_00595 [Mycobacterium dioxanotrophicus]|uniref:Uncharacterized protein n=2 Tax=Mycobacterium dioxanotrophicus TaxID=482462 RepID=A0A1Y0BWN0_9MYCO|nr:hypothetical protein BTO20_00595 [Mycobacterium dioxanotrophicus]